MAFTPLSSHFTIPPQRVAPTVEYQIPGYTGKVVKNLFINTPVVIIEDGICLPSQMGDLLAGRGNVASVSNVNALNLGTFTNCYKYDATGEGLPCANNGSGSTGLVQYHIEWHKIS